MKKLFSQVHQPFFVFAFINAVVYMLLFMLGFKGVLGIHISISMFHSYSLIFFVFTPAFLGFLFTVFPKFSSMPEIKESDYSTIFYMFLAGDLIFLISSVSSYSFMNFVLVFVTFALIHSAKFLISTYLGSKMIDKRDLFLILLAFIVGFVAHIGFFFDSTFVIAQNLSIYLYLFLLAFVVACRMIPFFFHKPMVKSNLFYGVVIALLALRVIFISIENLYLISPWFVDLALALVIAREIYRWKLSWSSNPLLWILYVSLLWVPVAFGIAAISGFISLSTNSNFLFLDVHALMLGFLFTVLIGFGTRVTLGHSGNMMHADKLSVFLFFFTQVVVLVRIAVSIVASLGMNFMILFDISITLWLVLLIVWAVKYFPVLIYQKQLKKFVPVAKPTFSIRPDDE